MSIFLIKRSLEPLYLSRITVIRIDPIARRTRKSLDIMQTMSHIFSIRGREIDVQLIVDVLI